MMRKERLKAFNTKKKTTTKNCTAIDDMDILKYINNLDDFRRKKNPTFPVKFYTTATSTLS